MKITKKRKANPEEAKCMDDVDECELHQTEDIEKKFEDEEIDNSPEIKRLKKTIANLEKRIEILENENNK